MISEEQEQESIAPMEDREDTEAAQLADFAKRTSDRVAQLIRGNVSDEDDAESLQRLNSRLRRGLIGPASVSHVVWCKYLHINRLEDDLYMRNVAYRNQCGHSIWGRFQGVVASVLWIASVPSTPKTKRFPDSLQA